MAIDDAWSKSSLVSRVAIKRAGSTAVRQQPQQRRIRPEKTRDEEAGEQQHDCEGGRRSSHKHGSTGTWWALQRRESHDTSGTSGTSGTCRAYLVPKNASQLSCRQAAQLLLTLCPGCRRRRGAGLLPLLLDLLLLRFLGIVVAHLRWQGGRHEGEVAAGQTAREAGKGCIGRAVRQATRRNGVTPAVAYTHFTEKREGGGGSQAGKRCLP